MSQSRTTRTSSGTPAPELRQVTSSIHQGQPCHPCILCKRGNQSKYFHPKSWKDSSLLKRLQDYEPSHNVKPDSCICRPCRNEVSNIDDDSFIPRWRKGTVTTVKDCYAPGCTSTAVKVTKIADRGTVQEFFYSENTAPVPVSTEHEVEGTPLCTFHYGAWYRHINPSHLKCKTCSKNITDATKSRSCPEPVMIQKFLRANTDFSGQIYPQDRVCYACYTSHIFIIKHMKDCIQSTDSDLSKLMDKIKEEIQNTPDIHTFDSAITYVSSILAVQLGEALLKQTAMLLPQVYENFKDELLKLTKQRGITIDQELPSRTWLRSQLSSLLEHHMAYRCSVMRYGTLLYRYGGDLVHALSVSLGQTRSSKCGQNSTGDGEFQKTLSDTCLKINAKCHACIKGMVEQDAISPHLIENVNIDEFINNLDPDIWKAVCMITQPLSSRAVKNESHVRKVRRFFCICTLFFTMNSQCSFPLHTLIADAIETCGGSKRLKMFFNGLGICASPETHARYVQYRVQKRKDEGPMASYPTDAFMIVSADNLDFIHSYARVYCGNQQSSWHATTVQIVQPKPHSLTTKSVQSGLRNEATFSPTNTSVRLGSGREVPIMLQPNLSKRSYSTRSPIKTTTNISPRPKKQRRRRTGMEGTYGNTPDQLPSMSTVSTLREALQKPNLNMATFQLNVEEKRALKRMRETSNCYMLLKVASTTHSNSLIDFQTYFSLSNNLPQPERSNIIYYNVLDQRCDDKETLLSIINDIYGEFISTNKTKFLLLEGDQATYERLQSIKAEYGNDLSWMVPFPGDWHLLKNFQEVLLKIYFDAGLNDLARASGYHPNAIGSNFKRTHHFLLEVWESIYRLFVSIFLSREAPSNFLEYTSNWIKSFPPSQDQESTFRNLNQLLSDVSEEYTDFQKDFMKLTDKEAEQHETSKFWLQFVFQDCFAYVSLYFAIRSGKWDLRVAAIKQMVALFTAFDRPKYQKLVPQHLVDMLTIPEEVLANLKQGGFTVSILGRPCHSIGIDEAHEMCINRECKEYITRPSADYISRTALFLPVRASAIKNMEDELFPGRKFISVKPITTIHAIESESKKLEANVRCQLEKLKSSTIAQDNSTGLHHLFNQKQPSLQQVHDLMKFRDIGQAEYERRVDYYILRNPSVQPPKHRKSLLTFTERRTRRKKESEIERERKIQIECWKKRVAFATSTGVQVCAAHEQCLELPRAIATTDGKPVKGTKSNITKVLEKRYEKTTPPIVSTSLKPGWVPETVVMEGMFLINITPWSAHKNVGDYADFLIRQHVLSHFRSMSKEVHLLFDDPECQEQSPKYFERQHRDQTNQVPDDHFCTDFSPDTIIPPKWRKNVLNCRKCKRKLVCFLSHHFLEKIQQKLGPQQRFVTAGGFDGNLRDKALFVTFNTSPECDNMLTCNAEESDTRIWLHVINSAGTKKLVLSPDTDVYHIGLPIIARTDLDVVVRLSLFSSLEHRLLDIQALLKAFNNDPELAVVDPTLSPSAMQMLYVCTGCDFISFFNGFGKATFLATLFEYSEFINSNTTCTPGTLADSDPNSNGFLSFLRLVGCAYFRKHKAVFLPSYPTPMTLFNSLLTEFQQPSLHHSTWLELIREKIWIRIKYEEEMIPSYDALQRHWSRSCWVVAVWSQATSNVITYPPLRSYGWKQPDPNTLFIDWDSDDNVSQIRARVALMQKGCGCRTGCHTARCKCKKGNNHCGPGCKCLGCSNLPSEATHQSITIDVDETIESSSDSESNIDEEVDEIMNEVFGDFDCDYVYDSHSDSSVNGDRMDCT